MGKYLNNSLGKDEMVIHNTKVHWGCLIPHIFLMLIGIGFFTIVFPLIIMFTTELGFTNKRILGKVGWLQTKTMDAPLIKINNVSVSNGILGKIFNYGDIRINTSSGDYNFKKIVKPEQFKKQLMAQIEQYDEDRIKKQAMEMARAMKDN